MTAYTPKWATRPQGVTQEQWEEALAWYRAGGTQEQVAASIGISVNSLRNWLYYAATRPPTRSQLPPPWMSEVDYLDVLKRYAAGEPIEQLVRESGMSASALRERARNAGLPRRPHSQHVNRGTRPLGISAQDWERATTRYRDGRPAAEIAAELGITVPLLRTWLSRCRVYRR